MNAAPQRRSTTAATLYLPLLASFHLFVVLAAAQNATAPHLKLSARIKIPRRPTKPVYLFNAVIHTVEDDDASATAMAYRPDGRIVAVGSPTAVKAALSAAALSDYTSVDMNRRFVMPGFQDVHTHVPEAGINTLHEYICAMDPGLSLNDYLDWLRFDCADAQPGSGWLRAAGASLFEFNLRSRSPLQQLDALFPNRPVIVLDDLGHGAWVNSVALSRARINTARDPPGGVLGYDSRGRFNGLLFENAQQKARDASKLPASAIYKGLLRALRVVARNGITTISDAGGFWTRGSVQSWARAEREDRVTVRAKNALYVYPDKPFGAQMARLKKLFSNSKSRLVSFNTAKIYVDGILDIGSALLRAPYNDAPNPDLPRGLAYFSAKRLKDYTAALIAAGFQINFHAIGDDATRRALAAVAAAPGGRQSRSRVTHAYLVATADLPKFKRTGVIADFQMAPVAISAAYRADMRPVLGSRVDRLVPIKEALDAGARVTISSDWDADPISPLKSIQRALLRDANWVPSVQTAIRMWTINAAFALKHADVTGSLRPGKQADYIVLDKNILKIPPQQIGTTKVLRTVVGGRVVHRA